MQVLQRYNRLRLAPGLAAALLALLALGPVQAAATTAYILNSTANELTRTDTSTGQNLGAPLTMPIDSAFHNIVETRSGLLVIGSGKQITLVEPNGWSIQATIDIPRAVLPNTDSDNTLVLEAAENAGGNTLFGLGYALTSDRVYAGITTAKGESFIYQINPSDQSIRLLAALPPQIRKPQDLVVSADGLRVYVSGLRYVPEPAAQVWPVNPANGGVGSPLGTAYDPARPQLSLSEDGNRLYLIAADDSVITVNTRTNSAIGRLNIDQGKIVRIRGAADNRNLWVSTREPDQVVLWDPLGENAPINRPLERPPLDIAATPDQKQLFILGDSEKQPYLETLEPKGTAFEPRHRAKQVAGVRRVFLAEGTRSSFVRSGLKRVAVLGFETQIQQGVELPDLSAVISGDLMWTRQYEIIPPLQVNSVLSALDLTPQQVRNSPEVVRQIMQGLNADVLIVGEPVKIEIPSRTLESLLSLVGGLFLGFPLPLGQINVPRVLTKAQAYDPQGGVVWKADVTNFDPGFLQGKSDILLINNSLIISAHDIANRFSDGVYDKVKSKTLSSDPPPLVQKRSALDHIHTIAIFGPDADLSTSDPNKPSESLGAVLAEQMRTQLGWQAVTPDETRQRLQQLGIDPAQVLSTDPRLLASLLGVDAICLGIVRGSTFYTGSIINIGIGTTADVVIQYQIVTAKGDLAWQDIQVTNVPGYIVDERTTAARKAADLMITKLKTATQPVPVVAAPQPAEPNSPKASSK
ncbi:YncE family protein [Anthocerotibacter panamensis]|uniref:YncE family protein n=1 Tax=Anthocerotibacter panamensis TaxID=2857077 RepID=UPI001C407EED|nr:hypothetical protein [Anthocerotibacter panamensis]